MEITKGKIKGTLFAKLASKGTRSEGYSYWLRPSDDYGKKWNEILIRKKTMRWMDDPRLHPFIDKQVWIEGEIIETKNSITIDYENIGIEK